MTPDLQTNIYSDDLTRRRAAEPGDLGKYDPEDLARLRGELQQSVQKRIEKMVQLGSDYGHSKRLAEEQALIRSIEKHLTDR